MDPDTPLLERIVACSDLTESEQIVADFYTDSYPGAALLTLQEVCAATGVSTATVGRFARKLGYGDFRALRVLLQAEVRERLDAPRDRLARLTQGSVREGADDRRYAMTATDLRETARGLDPATLDRLAALVGDDRRPLYLGAVASGQPLLHYFALLLSYLRGGVTLLDGVDRWPHNLVGLSNEAVVLAAAFDRYPTPVQRLLRFAKGRGATTILVTNRRSGPLVREADMCVFVASSADPMFRSRVGTLFVLEMILDAVGRRRAAAQKRATELEHLLTLFGGYLPTSGKQEPV